MTNEERYEQAHTAVVESIHPCGGELGHLISEIEEWRSIPGLDAYQVSNHGRVRSLTRWKRGRLLALNSSDRYVRVTLGKGRVRTVHRLVLEAFVGPPEAGQVCRHLDGDKTNNRLCNLAWGTPSENEMDKVGHGSHRNASKTHCVNGHPFDETNTDVVRNGWRECKTCRRDRQRDAYWRRRGQVPTTDTPATKEIQS